MSFRRLKDIRPMEKPQPIEIRVVKKWMAQTKTKDGVKSDLCYQFVDKYGDGIEAIADAGEVEYYDSIIRLQSCYRVTGYVCTKARDFMATVNHTASLTIGKKARFVPTDNLEIPTIYFGFAHYGLLKGRVKDNSLLTGMFTHKGLTK
ncbi:putative nucleic acid-binding protein [Helianthus annuus]|nr:putative nucleic acid-binding protein [Helianthus annuus]